MFDPEASYGYGYVMRYEPANLLARISILRIYKSFSLKLYILLCFLLFFSGGFLFVCFIFGGNEKIFK